MLKVTKDILKKVYPDRPKSAHKYDFGLLLIIGGGEFYTGSPALAGMAAFKAGVDMVQVLAPARAANIIASFSPNLAAYPLKGKWLDKENLPTLISITEAANQVAPDKTAVVIGGGLGRSEDTREAVLEYLERLSPKENSPRAVIDADGIHAIANPSTGGPEKIKGKKFIITPHTFEFFVLTGKEIKNLNFEEKIKMVREEAARFGSIILLKGEKDIISDGHEVAINEVGSPYLTVGGTGDTLAGICGSLLAQGIEPFLAAQAAAFINGKAGEIAVKRFGLSFTATDLIEEIPKVLK